MWTRENISEEKILMRSWKDKSFKTLKRLMEEEFKKKWYEKISYNRSKCKKIVPVDKIEKQRAKERKKRRKKERKTRK